ncbi:hypothetical protein [Elizabethkingia ursingii]|nr:hypothetical protein [Elizabethkingia ursingii]MCL1670370.1 hypothetical protein [Elizabethkingia ursingii]
MKNLKTLKRDELRVIGGGMAPRCCIGWNPITKECRGGYDPNCENPGYPR